MRYRAVNLQNLEENLVNPTIVDYRKVALDLEQNVKLRKVNSQKLRKLTKKISSLQFMKKISQKQTFRIQNKIVKLQQTQTYAHYLNKLKYQTGLQQHKQLINKRHFCNSVRQTKMRNKQLSFSLYQTQKESKVQKFKDTQENLLQRHRKRMQDMLKQKRKKSRQIKEFQENLRQKFKKYEEFKLFIAQRNYAQKVQSQYRKSKQKQKYLSEIKEKEREQRNLFRKTQILNDQTSKIQSVYLTGIQLK